MSASKADIYREVFKALGDGVKLEDFSRYCKQKYGIDVPKSSFYAAKRGLQQRPTRFVAPTNGNKEPDGLVIPVSEVPVMLGLARELVKRCGGDKELASFLLKEV